ncbi:MAG: energy coupling factor transporter S component ThiW [Promethearchaeota archaeon]
MMDDQKHFNDEKEKKFLRRSINIKIAASGIFIAVGLILSYLNPFAYFTIFGARINPFAHLINAITGVLIGLAFSCVTALGIAILRFSLGIGTIHAFHGGITGAIVVGIVSYFLRKKYPKYVEFAAFAEPLGTVFLGGTIAHLITPIANKLLVESLLIWWGLFAASCIPGCIMGYIILMALKKAKITWEDFY